MFEQIIEELKVYPPNGQGILEVKDKKTKVKYLVEFEKPEQ